MTWKVSSEEDALLATATTIVNAAAQELADLRKTVGELTIRNEALRN